MNKRYLKISSILFVVLFINLFSLNGAIAKISQTEREALIALYNSSNGDDWIDKSGWKGAPLDVDGFAMPGTENTWYGITCDSSDTTVLSIYLWDNNLKGTIPAKISGLSNIVDIFMPNNQLSGSIPSELGNLVNLQTLSLTNNLLTGSIPASLGNLTKLVGLYLGANLLSGTIPAELGNLANLSVLQMGCQLTGSLPKELGKLTKLTGIYLGGNQLTGTIPTEFGNLGNLQELYLDDNQLSGSIPPELANLTRLKLLGLSENHLTGTIPAELGSMANLENLSLGGNYLTGTIPIELGNLTNLQGLFLDNNQLTGSIPKELGNLNQIQSIYLKNNQLTGTIPTELGNLTNFRYLVLSNNKLIGPIPLGLGNSTNFITLNLDNNKLDGTIPVEFGNLLNLQTLDLGYNRLSGSIPSEIGNLPRLTQLGLNSNQLNGKIPSSIANLKGSSYFHIEYNALHTDDEILIKFLDNKNPGWKSTQTLAPRLVEIVYIAESSMLVKWTPADYSYGDGNYLIYRSTTPGGPYTLFNDTVDKSVTQMKITGLNLGASYYFVIQTETFWNLYNQNTVYSDYSDEISATIVFDADNDGMANDWEIAYFNDISRNGTGDYDSDGVTDFLEYKNGTNPVVKADSDADGISDDWELIYFKNLSRDGTGDFDGDGLIESSEYQYGANPTLKDTDGDGFNDSLEVQQHSSPKSGSDTPAKHIPIKPVIHTDIKDVALRDNLFKATNYSDPDNDPMSASEWQISKGTSFDESRIIMEKVLELNAGIQAKGIDPTLLTMSESIFLPNTDYSIRARFKDGTGLWSPWSDTVAFTTVMANPYDADNNGVDDSYQVSGSTDTNNNGIADSTEGILAVADAEKGETVGMTVDTGTVSGLTSLSTEDLPDGILTETMPYGLFSYRVDGLTSGSTVNIIFYFPVAVPSRIVWYKYDSADGTITDCTDNIVVDGNKVTLSIIDGGKGDADGIANGCIIDPSGPVYETGTVAAPTFSPSQGTYTSPQSISILCATADAIIHYTTDGSEPTESSTAYSSALSVSNTVAIKAKAYRIGWASSDTATATYTITGIVSTPTFSPSQGTYTSPQSISILCATADAIIHYTTDGSEPGESPTVYSSPISVSGTTIIKAKGYKAGWIPSETVTATYAITGTVSTPTFSPSQGTYTSAQNVSLSCSTADAIIHYTTDGSEPTESSTAYLSAISVSSTTTLKAKAYRIGWASSGTAAATYTINSGSQNTGSGGGGGGGGGIFGEISLSDVIGYHLDEIRDDGIVIFMPVTEGFKSLKGAQTHIEKFAPAMAKIIRSGFDLLENKAEPNKNGLLYKTGAYIFPVLGKIAEFYLDIVGSKELMTNAYSGTTISISEFNKLQKLGIAIAPHVVKDTDKQTKK
jgi:Leucine-rich repeat (LRR) protein